MSFYVKMGLYSNITSRDTRKIYLSLCNEAKKRLREKRQVMYSDLINIICSKNLVGKEYIQVLQWCSFNIKIGKDIINFHGWHQ